MCARARLRLSLSLSVEFGASSVLALLRGPLRVIYTAIWRGERWRWREYDFAHTIRSNRSNIRLFRRNSRSIAILRPPRAAFDFINFLSTAPLQSEIRECRISRVEYSDNNRIRRVKNQRNVSLSIWLSLACVIVKMNDIVTQRGLNS